MSALHTGVRWTSAAHRAKWVVPIVRNGGPIVGPPLGLSGIAIHAMLFDMSMTSSSRVLQGMVHGLATLIAIGCSAALIAVIASVVRRERPDAFKPLLLWSILSLAAQVFFWLLNAVGPALVSRGEGIEAITTFFTVTAALHIPVSVGVTALLGVGLVRLAKPAPPVVVPHEPPYR
jgi:hypothetical protein